MKITIFFAAVLGGIPFLAGATTYDVGPNRPLDKLSSVSWGALQPGDIVNIYPKPGGYHEIIQISESGTENNRIVIRGIPDPVTKALPIIDGKGAIMDPKVDFRDAPVGGGTSVFETFGAILVTPRKTGYVYGQTFPSYITIESLDIRNALYDASGANNFTDNHGQSRIFDTFACGIYVEYARHLVIRGCEISNCGNGIFANSKNLAAQSTIDLLIEGNYLHDNGMPKVTLPDGHVEDGYHDHNIYVEAAGVVYQYNRLGPLRAGCHGSMIKNRSSGTVIRYNEIESTETATLFYILEPEGGYGYVNLQPDYKNAYIYGNVITVRDSTFDGPALVRFTVESDPSVYANTHRDTVYFYSNTVVSHKANLTAFTLRSPQPGESQTIFEKVDCRNNVFYTDSSIQSNVYNAFRMIVTPAFTTALFGANWVSPNTSQTWKGHESPATIIGWNFLIGNGPGSQNNPGFASLAGGDYHLDNLSEPYNEAGPFATGVPPVTEEYVFPQSHKARTTAQDLGAFEYGVHTSPPTGGAPPDPTPIPNSKLTISVKGKSKLQTSKAKLVIKGSTAGGATSVTYRVGKKGKWLTAKGVATWQLSAKLKNGRNILYVVASKTGQTTVATSRVTILRK